MRIWKGNFDIEMAGKSRKDTMVDYLGIEFTEVGDDYLKARMPVDDRTRQPHGTIHGGASCALAETVGSVAGSFCLDREKNYCVGIEINTSHIKMVKEGYVIGTAKPLHLGRSTQVWEILIHDEKGRLVSVNRLRLSVLEKKEQNL